MNPNVHAIVVAAAALLGGLAIRLLKDDTVLPTLPAKARPWLSIAFGAIAAGLEKFAGGSAWKDAITTGLIVGLGPIAGHLLGIEWLRDGKELPLPAALVKGDDEGGGPKPPTMPPAVLGLLFIGIACVFMGACSYLRTPEAKTVIDIGKPIACAVLHAELDDATVDKICEIVAADQPAAHQAKAAANQKLAAEREKMSAKPCSAPVSP